MNGFAVAVVEIVKGGHGIVVKGAGLHVINAMDPISALPYPMGLAFIVPLGVRHGWRIGNGFSLVSSMIAGSRHKGVMNGLEGEIKKEGGGLVFSFQPFQSLVSQEVIDVTTLLFLCSVDVEGGVEILSLPAEADPVMKSFLRRINVVAHVPLANKGSAISMVLKGLREKMDGVRHRTLVVNHTMSPHGLPRQNGSPTGRAKGGRDECIFKVCSLGCHAIQVGGFQKVRGLGMKAHEVVAMIVAENQNEIGPPRSGRFLGCDLWDRFQQNPRGEEIKPEGGDFHGGQHRKREGAWKRLYCWRWN